MAKEQYFVASMALVSDVISMWRAAGATFVRDTYTGESGALLTNLEGDIAEASSFRFFVYDLPPASIKLRLDTVRTDYGELRTFVQQRYGSPYIDFSFIKARRMEDFVVAGHGNLSIYPYYYDLDTNERIKPSNTLVELFRSAGRHIRKQSNVERSPITPKTFLVEKQLKERGSGHWPDYRISPESSKH